MKLKVIVDNNTYIDQYYYGEPAVCYYIEDGDNKLLLDVGYSDLFLKNMEKLEVQMESVDTIVISHGHDDHARGLKYLFESKEKRDINIVAHPQAFDKKVFEGEVIGSPLTIDELDDLCKMTLSKAPIKVSDNITFLGEIPKLNDFEKREAIGEVEQDGVFVGDTLMDDSALVYQGIDGIYIITGCSHSGVCNIIEYAKQVTGCDTVMGVIGGFHLFDLSERVEKTIDYFKENNIKALYPCHCTSFKVRAAIHEGLPIDEVGVGMTIEWT